MNEELLNQITVIKSYTESLQTYADNPTDNNYESVEILKSNVDFTLLETGIKALTEQVPTLYMRRAANVAFRFAPAIYACKKCGNPYATGYCCSFCGDSNPSSTKEEDDAFFSN